MRIGKFAQKYSVTIDTVRHYIHEGLLIPDTRSPQSEFGDRECRDMETILHMKQQNFSLKEIHQYLDITRVSNMTEPESIQMVRSLLEYKKGELQEEIEKLQDIIESIDEDLEDYNYDIGQGTQTGLPIKALDLLICPDCGRALNLGNASLNSRYIFEGILRCSCGYHAEIKNGILRTKQSKSDQNRGYDKPYITRFTYKPVSSQFVTYLEKSCDYIGDRLKKMDLKDKVVLESHVNAACFLYKHHQYVDSSCTYILIDKYPEILELYKSYIDSLRLDLDIVYIADATMNWPIKHGKVNVIIDAGSANVHSLYWPTPYIHDVRPYLAIGFKIYGINLGLARNTKSFVKLHEKYPEGDVSGYDWDRQPQIYHDERCIYTRKPVGSMYETFNGHAFDCHEDGEELKMGCYMAASL